MRSTVLSFAFGALLSACLEEEPAHTAHSRQSRVLAPHVHSYSLGLTPRACSVAWLLSLAKETFPPMEGFPWRVLNHMWQIPDVRGPKTREPRASPYPGGSIPHKGKAPKGGEKNGRFGPHRNFAPLPPLRAPTPRACRSPLSSTRSPRETLNPAIARLACIDLFYLPK